MGNFPIDARTTNYNTYDFDPSGDGSVDTPAWESLVAAINANTPVGKSSVIRIRDNGQSLMLDSAFSTMDTSEFLKGCWVRGETKNARIQYNNGYIINWGRYGNPVRLTDTYSWFQRGTIAATAAWTSRVVPTGVTLAQGDWVLVWSDDNITGVAAHHGNSGFQRAAQLCRVNHQDAGGWVLDTDIVDPLTTNPRICKIDMLRGCGMSDLTFGSDNVNNDGLAITSVPQKSCVNVQRCHGFRAENIQVDETGAGGFDLQLCADSEVAGYNGTYQFDNRRIYAVTIGVCTNVIYRDSVWHNTRHMITSFGLQVTAGDNIRYGTAIGCKGINLYQYISGDVIDTAFAGMDMHAESWGFELRDCHVFNSQWWDAGQEQFFAFSTRARNTRFIGCYVHSAMTQTVPGNLDSYYGQPAVGWRIMANDALISHCQQDRGWQGVLIQPDTVNNTFFPQRTKIEYSRFENVSGPAVYMNSGAMNELEFYYNTMDNCGRYYTPAGSPSFHGAALRVRGGTGHKIRFNNIDKGTQDYAFDFDNLIATDLDIYSNSCKGYGSGKLGVRGDTGDPRGVSTTSGPSIQSAFASKNNVD